MNKQNNLQDKNWSKYIVLALKRTIFSMYKEKTHFVGWKHHQYTSAPIKVHTQPENLIIVKLKNENIE